MSLNAVEIVEALFGSNELKEDRLWNDLLQANRLAAALRTKQAADLYAEITRNGALEEVFANRTWALSGSPTGPNLAWACVYLRESVFLDSGIKPSQLWQQLAEVVVNDSGYPSLPDPIKSILISTQGWVSLRTKAKSLKEILAEQLAALKSLKISGTEAAHHHIVIGSVYRLLREPALAISHLEQAVDIYVKQQNEFYIYHSKRTLAGAFLYLNDFDKGYFNRALQLYEATFTMLPDSDPRAKCEHYYDVGWVYVETAFYDKALDTFYDGYSTAYANNFDVELAKLEWGIGRTYYSTRDLDQAVNLLRSASLRFEYNRMKLMVAMCIQVEAACLQRMGLVDEALELVEKRGLPLQRQVDDPVQLYHMLRRLVSLYCQKRDFSRAGIIWEYFSLKRKLKK
jgi:tetratricopeptide (TPR) repeat protein